MATVALEPLRTLTRVSKILAGRTGYAIAGLILLAYVVVALKPFRWDPPRFVENGLIVDNAGVLRFHTPGIARTPEPPRWLGKVSDTGAINISLRARSLHANQFGPARIFTISSGHTGRNLTIAQGGGSDLWIRIWANKLPWFIMQLLVCS